MLTTAAGVVERNIKVEPFHSLLMGWGGGGGGGGGGQKRGKESLHLDLPLHDVVGDSTYWY